jgi:hypothetical protein
MQTVEENMQSHAHGEIECKLTARKQKKMSIYVPVLAHEHLLDLLW